MQEQHMLLFLNLRHELQLPGTTEHCLCEYEKTKRWMAAFDKRWPGMHLLQALVQDDGSGSKKAHMHLLSTLDIALLHKRL